MRNEKKPVKLFDKFYRVWLVITLCLLVGCILWYFFIEKPNNSKKIDVMIVENNTL